MQHLLETTLDDLRASPIAHVAVLLPEDVHMEGGAQHVWFCFVRVAAGALKGAVLLFRIGLEEYPSRPPTMTAVTSLGPFAEEISESLRLQRAAYTATTPMTRVLVGLCRAVTEIDSDARDGAALAASSRADFDKSFSDVFIPTEEVAALAGTIDRQASLLRDSRSFLTASELFLSQSGAEIGLSQSK